MFVRMRSNLSQQRRHQCRIQNTVLRESAKVSRVGRAGAGSYYQARSTVQLNAGLRWQQWHST